MTRRKKKKKSSTLQESLEQMLERLQIEDWDLVLVGDGSGSNYERQCGWASISIEHQTFERQYWYGAMNYGTVNLAEMLAYLQPLSWYAAREDERRRESRKNKQNYKSFRNVHIITDSKYCKQQGESDNLSPKKNGGFWRIFDTFTRHGIILHWHWIPRESVELNILVDQVAKETRLLLKQNDIREVVERDQQGKIIKTVYDYNPN